jgi:MoaA/NifB/PqqE/SkfB family radical SAM enzyme
MRHQLMVLDGSSASTSIELEPSLAAPTTAAPPRPPLPSPMVHGLSKVIVEARIWARIAHIAVRAYGPTRALTVLLSLRARRVRMQRRSIRKYARAGKRYFWNLHAPGWPSPAFDRHIEQELDRIQPFRGAPVALHNAVFAITKRCGYRCEHCCEWDVLNAPEALSADDLREVVQRLIEAGVTQLFLSGGEPLRRFKELLQIVEQAAPMADVWILTSGQSLTPPRASRLRTAGLTGVAISLDHWDPASNDRFRGMPGAFRSVEAAAHSAHEAGLLVALSLCPTRQFISEQNLEQYARTARQLGAAFIQLFEPKSIGHYAGLDVALTADQQRMLEDFCKRLNTHSDRRELPAVAYSDLFNRRNGCPGAGDRYLYVDTDGSVHPCPFCRGTVGSALAGHLGSTLAEMRVAGCQSSGCNRGST